jgi:hypothetical protein
VRVSFLRNIWCLVGVGLEANVERSTIVINLKRSFLIVWLRLVKMYNIVASTGYGTIANL